MKIKEVENLNRRLKRKIQNLETNKLETTVSSDVQPGPSSNSSEGVDTMLMGSVSPASKKGQLDVSNCVHKLQVQ